MYELTGLLFTLFIGMFILIGTAIVKLTKNNDKFVHFSISIALGVIVSLLILDLIPESFELLGERYDSFVTTLMVIGFSTLGLLILMALESLIPHHGHGHGEELFHLGLVSSIAIILHNVIEGMAIYATINTSVSMGFLMGLGVGLHNIPMGMVITSALDKSKTKISKTSIILFLISISTFVGGLIMYLSGSILNNSTLLGIVLSITQGMLIYIVVFELLPHIKHGHSKQNNIIGIIIGILIMLISTLFH
ncbi:MAG: ZIP family metal transporter [Bacilli bacterium]|nr:ZIP family metal transporter [Bacilli bacterium]MDD4547993.1 ZIP family metal transporter [Bacilli bacterium]